MIVTGKKSFENSGAKSEINKALADFKVTYFNDFEAKPLILISYGLAIPLYTIEYYSNNISRIFCKIEFYNI